MRPKKQQQMKIGIQILLWILIVFFGYKVYDSINGPLDFNKTKTERYAKVIDRLKDIRNAQIAHKSVTGVYANSFESLISFVDSAQYTLVEKRDSSYLEYDLFRRVVVIQLVLKLEDERKEHPIKLAFK